MCAVQQVRLEEGTLIMSRNGLGNMTVALELEVAYGCGRDSLLALHTLVLSCNQLKVCIAGYNSSRTGRWMEE